MSDFTPITSQEEFDKMIQKRLAQKEREVSEQFKDYLSPDKAAAIKADYEKQLQDVKESVKDAQEKLKSNDSTVAELTKRATDAEKTLLKNKIAYENKLPLELANRLVGETEADLAKDAETLAALLKPTSAPPLRTNEVAKTTGTNNGSLDAGMMQLLSQLSDQMN